MPTAAAPDAQPSAATADQASKPAGQASAATLPASATTKPFIEDTASDVSKVHLIDEIITETVRMDPAYIGSPSDAIRSIYDSFACILDTQGIDITSRTQDYSISRPSTGRRRLLSSFFIVASNVVYDRWRATGDMIIKGALTEVSCVHQRPHLHQSSVSVINFCVAERALMRLSRHQLHHELNVLIHLKIQPASLIKGNILAPLCRPSHPDMEIQI